MQTNTSFAQPPPLCPCPCDEILSDYPSGPNNSITFSGYPGENCLYATIKLKSCGGRTIRGFSISIPSPNCFEDKRVEVTMDGVNYGIVDLGSTPIPSTFFLDSVINPCDQRVVEVKFCFPDGDRNDCFRQGGEVGPKTYNMEVNYLFNPNDPPCETQTVVMETRYYVVLSVEEETVITELFEINDNILVLKNNFEAKNIILYDMEGKVVLNVNNKKLDLSSVKSGAYLIVIDTGNKMLKTTYIKQN